MKVENIVNDYLKITKKKGYDCKFEKAFISEKDKLRHGDKCKVSYRFYVWHGEKLLYIKTSLVDSWFEWDNREEKRFERSIISELILKAIFTI